VRKSEENGVRSQEEAVRWTGSHSNKHLPFKSQSLKNRRLKMLHLILIFIHIYAHNSHKYWLLTPEFFVKK